MTKLLFTAAAFAIAASALTFGGSTPSQAAAGTWCAYTNANMSNDCSFQSFAQCKATVAGQAGNCVSNVSLLRDAQARFTAPRAQIWEAAANTQIDVYKAKQLGGF